MGFIEEFVEYIRLRTDADYRYAEILGLQLLGHVIGKGSVHNIQPDYVWHNMYVCLIGDSTVSRKTTVQDLCRDVYPQKLVLPDDFSPEAFLTALSKQSQGIVFMGEFSRILKKINQKSYMSSIIETWNDLFRFRSDVYVRDLQKGKIEIIYPYFSINTTCTDTVIKQKIDEEMMEGGFLARWLFVEGKPSFRQRNSLPNDIDEKKKKFQQIFKELYEISGKQGFTFKFDVLAKERYDQIEQLLLAIDDVKPFAGRYLEYIITIADLLCLSDYIYKVSNVSNVSNGSNGSNGSNSNNCIHTSNISTMCVHHLPLIISKAQLDHAYAIIVPCIDYVKKLHYHVVCEKHISKFVDYVEKHAPCLRRDLMHGTGISARQLRYAVDTVGEDGQEKILVLFGKSNVCNKQTEVYCLSEYKNTERCKTCKWKCC